ncbi:hypothetical protein [Amycolatopsis sp. cmx-11-51]|uniref:hypothetical protein n=1 Tax=Amycolatopsis sp. cmx-11-51 TaxID=2785797 RepID=UPI0039E21E8C
MDDPGFAGLVRGLAATEGQDATPAPPSAEADPDDSALEIVSSSNDHELWPKLGRGLSGESWPELTASYQRWLPLVNRFSFAADD